MGGRSGIMLLVWVTALGGLLGWPWWGGAGPGAVGPDAVQSYPSREAATVQRAVIDRIVDGQMAVLLVGDEEVVLEVPVSELPAGAREGHWLQVELDDAGRFVGAELDEAATDAARERIRDKLDRLRGR